MPRAILIVLDSVGCGAAEDAADYGDVGADTLGHIAEACARGDAAREGVRSGPIVLPWLDRLGLGSACLASIGRVPPGLHAAPRDTGWGYGVERSAGKDTPSGHWELAGTPVPFAWGYFPQSEPCFPQDLVTALVSEGKLPGILGNRHASGTSIIEELGDEHLRTGKPICYTSIDSVFQIAAHEESFGLTRLYDLCRIARRLCDPLNIGRVIARPFVGHSHADFRRTANRKDFAVPPPSGHLLARAAQAGRAVVSIGKIGDIFAHVDTGTERKGASNDANLDLVLETLPDLADGGLIVANLVDFDTEFGHRRDVAGYAACLEAFDRRVPEIIERLRPDDLLILVADHGNDPTFRGNDHTREHVPILAHCAARDGMRIGRRGSLADVGATIARHLGLSPTPAGEAWF
ncbi:phosphopentomutase [Lichenifustis flavocetrariae]|uniref:Phosphopentomutase n=1 Tax=Lichenifustis flavocetrariae TaxID=2949735 RepID=A0AA41YSJ9_9HYPH|nr:phosphopentomutase [Lichenifustis flavocetrariae]MCW6507389.1 phosphopentomutase [Lichenifustis flavocetrariae]